MNESTIPTIPVYENETLDVENEWDTESIAKQITEKSPLIIRSKYAGGGKSHIAKHFSKLGYKTLFVVPQNSLSQNIDDTVDARVLLQLISFLPFPSVMGRNCPSLTIANITA